MKTDKEYLTQLVLFEISGKIREDEKAELNRMIREDQEAAGLYRQLHATWQDDAMQSSAVNNWGPDEIWKAIHQRKRQRIIHISLKGFVALSAMAILGIFIIKIPAHHTPQPLAASNPSHIRLQLSGGQLIDLSDKEGRLQAGSATFNNNNKQLRFIADSGQSQYATITVPAGKEYTVHLPDGSAIQLNAASQLFFPIAFKGHAREITLYGEAYMKIAPSADHPFLVHLPGATIQVLGTEFNVNTYDSNLVKVALVNGAVKVNTDHDTALLKPGFESALTRGKEMKIYRFDEEDVLAWRQGLHLFHNASAEEVARLIHRFYGIPVQLDIKPEHAKAFTGSINRNKPAVNFLEGLKFAQYMDYYFDKDSILHLRPLRTGV
ncbi:FecR family protein [Chitinophaga sp. 22321]|uniref:FecR domain-containing protein n=1 Tax=Chitinophaga hostae TaxID=2831022 RepID=A0ABS5JC55_9BACT|nr:FecR family protein [Chitinophaga hostae]MBS0032052.1 FecR domain-containing protein [Chitinophaga hostae]